MFNDPLEWLFQQKWLATRAPRALQIALLIQLDEYLAALGQSLEGVTATISVDPVVDPVSSTRQLPQW